MSPAKRSVVLEMLAEGKFPTGISRSLGVPLSVVKRVAKDVRGGGDGQPRPPGRVGKGALYRTNTMETIEEVLKSTEGKASVATMKRSLSDAGLDWSMTSVRTMLKETSSLSLMEQVISEDAAVRCFPGVAKLSQEFRKRLQACIDARG